MQEVLSKAADPKTPPRDQEFYELNLYDSDSAGERVYCMREARARWDDESKQAIRDEEHFEQFLTLEEAEKRYAERRLALAEEGFIYSDMDLF